MLCDPAGDETFNEYFDHFFEILNIISYVIFGLQLAVSGVSIKLIFCTGNRKNRPSFVSLFWGLIFVSQVLLVSELVLVVLYMQGSIDSSVKIIPY